MQRGTGVHASALPPELAKVQDDEVGDGTTSVCVLASELLREAEKLVNQHVHPQTVVDGYRIASKAALTALEASAVNFGADAKLFENELLNIAKTTLSSKVPPPPAARVIVSPPAARQGAPISDGQAAAWSLGFRSRARRRAADRLCGRTATTLPASRSMPCCASRYAMLPSGGWGC